MLHQYQDIRLSLITQLHLKNINIGSEKEDVINNETVFMNCIILNSLKEEKQTKKKNKTCKMALKN